MRLGDPHGPQYGTVQISTDRTYLTYTPTTLDYLVNGVLTGNQDAFQVGIKDNFGGTVTSYVQVKADPVANIPTVDAKSDTEGRQHVQPDAASHRKSRKLQAG